jgi:hypothetical protein
VAKKAAGPERPGDTAIPEETPGTPDRANDAGRAGAHDGASEPDATPADEARSGFRAALERKRAQNANAASLPRGKNAGKIHGARGPAANRRSFRRKSG